MNRYRAILRLLAGPLFAVGLSGCVTGASPATRFYSLDLPVSTPVLDLPEATRGPAVGVGPIALPDLLERPNIVSRSGGHGIVLAEFDRWAGDLRSDLTRVVVRRLMQRLHSGAVYAHPWPGFRHIDYQVRVEVLRFDGTLGGTTEISGTWSLLDGDGEEAIASQVFSITRETGEASYEAFVASLGQAAEGLADRIAGAIDRLDETTSETGEGH